VTHFPVDAPKIKVIKTCEMLGFSLVREREHIALIREDADGTKTPVTLPNHSTIKGSTLRTICTQAGIPREEFLKAYQNVSSTLRLSSSAGYLVYLYRNDAKQGASHAL